MRQVLIAVMFFLILPFVKGQGNLVPNPGFEIHTGCAGAQISLATGWLNPTSASPDYHNSCEITNNYGVPNNFEGEQIAHTGVAYGGIIAYDIGYREYIQIGLVDSLVPSKTYCVTYFVSLAGKSQYAIIAPQLYLCNNQISSGTSQNLNYPPQVINSIVVSDTSNWTIITAVYQAIGGERYITIGNFYDDANSQLDTIQTGLYATAYYYIDDVSVYEKVDASAGSDLSICPGDSVNLGSTIYAGINYRWNTSSGLSDSTIAQPWAKPDSTTTYYLTIADTGSLYCLGNSIDSVTVTVNDCTPPPVFNVPTILHGNDQLAISALPANTHLELFDERGRLVFNNENYQNDFSVINLNAGIYLYRLYFPNGTSQKGKVCVVK